MVSDITMLRCRIELHPQPLGPRPLPIERACHDQVTAKLTFRSAKLAFGRHEAPETALPNHHTVTRPMLTENQSRAWLLHAGIDQDLG